MGIFWKRGNKYAAITSMSVGFALAVILETTYHGTLPWAYGLTSGAVALGVNVLVYIVIAYLLPQDVVEKQRIEKLFAMVSDQQPDTHVKG
jgi:SSS family solute:Na+ symporter